MRTVIGYDLMWYPISAYDVMSDESCHFSGIQILVRLGFNPFGEVVNSDQNVFMPIASLWRNLTNYVDTPDGKRPRRCHGI
ncbi:hypothetical protein LguiB_032035 [Lonicera macranthoides]